jgi:uncharacterized protein YjaZ
MKKTLLFFLNLSLATIIFGQNQKFVSSDVDNFWTAYDKISATTDTLLKAQYLQAEYLDKASEGLKSLMKVRRYTAKEYLNAIEKYPLFWQSIRENTKKTSENQATISDNIEKLRKIYPTLKPSTIYFAVGVFRTNGTIDDQKVLIGTEMALADDATKIKELPEGLHFFYQNFHPLKNIALLCTHEYVHTQQQEPLDNLLCNSLYEGVAEFISCLATQKPSSTPSFTFGKQNEALVKKRFEEDLFLRDRMYNWIWGINRNELKERDLGYYVGYRICEEYYNQAKNKEKAINELINLDYTNDAAVEKIVDKSGFFSKSVAKMNKSYEKSRPKVVEITPFKNGSKNVKPGLTKITVHFSAPLNKINSGIDFGPLGETHCPKITLDNRKWSEEGKSWTFEADLKPNQEYQMLITNSFRLPNGIRLKSYLITLTTGN